MGLHVQISAASQKPGTDLLGMRKFCCGGGNIRSLHPCELIGDDWYDWLQQGNSRRLTRTDLLRQPVGDEYPSFCVFGS
jgi:hypothetical protein